MYEILTFVIRLLELLVHFLYFLLPFLSQLLFPLFGPFDPGHSITVIVACIPKSSASQFGIQFPSVANPGRKKSR